MALKWIAPQSRFILKVFFKRNFDYMNEAAQSMVNRAMLVTDVAVVVGVFMLL